MKNPLFYKPGNANKLKIVFAKRKLMLGLAGLFAVLFMVTLSIDNSASAKGVLKCAGISIGALAMVPMAAGAKGTLEKNGVNETDEEFAARKGSGESEAAFAKRLMIHTIDERLKVVKGEVKAQLEELRTQIGKEKAESELLQNLKAEMEKHGLDIKALQENGKGQGSGMSLKDQVNKFISDNATKIKQLKDAGSGFIELKAVGNMTTGSVSNPDGIPTIQGVQIAPPSNVNLRSTIIAGLVSIFNTTLSSYAYTESVPKDGSYTFIGEGVIKTQIDFKIETRYASPKKIAAWMKLTDESVTDIPGLQSIAYDYLRKQHDLKKQNGMLFGNGAGDNPKGATTYGRAFVPGGMANAVANPNFMDIINATITDIFVTHNYQDEMPYMANIVMINPLDFYINLVAAKDGFGRPLYPMASLFNRVVIGGATIIPFEDIPAGKIFTADLSRYNITDYVGYTVRIGWINDDFIYNQFVILGESRFHAFVKKLDEQAFIYDDIATIKAAIAAA